MDTHLIQIEATPATIDANFDEAERQLREHLKQYDVVVAPEAVGDAKKLRTELRKQISELDKRIKDVLAEAGAPIKQADERRKQLIQLGKDVDAKIKEQIDQREEKNRATAEKLLTALRHSLFEKYGVEDEFKRAEFDDLILVSSVNKDATKLTKKARDTLDTRVQADKALQDRTERRIAELARASYESGLIAPIERQHVEHFLFVDDEQFKAKLLRVLDTEIDRQQKAEQRMRDNAEREARQKVEAERKENERKARLAEQENATQDDSTPQEADPEPATEAPDAGTDEAAEPEAPAKQAPTEPFVEGNVVWHVVCTFRIEVPPHVTPDAIREGAKKKLEAAGITTLQNVTCQKETRHDRAA